jgi:hypothetical protein
MISRETYQTQERTWIQRWAASLSSKNQHHVPSNLRGDVKIGKVDSGNVRRSV